MAKPTTPQKADNSDDALVECRGALRAGIRGVPVDEPALDLFIAEFVATFQKVLRGPKRIEWHDARAHVTHLAWTLGVLAEFYAVCAPPKRETVGRAHLIKAFDTIKKDCKDFGPLGSERFIFCPPAIV
jgi:hypothetical protein